MVTRAGLAASAGDEGELLERRSQVGDAVFRAREAKRAAGAI
jgi:hypothetical protein